MITVGVDGSRAGLGAAGWAAGEAALRDVPSSPRGSWRADGSRDVIVEFFDGGHEAGIDLRCH
ncbi:hypothetical protein [Nonomuraea candida]|uniref:hypothetical protein n=1 Tax=Nonomuraea candida TaxID=359159 RepID=UPI0005BC2EEC|nr:hypothetical protein [Nonomuraea candida]